MLEFFRNFRRNDNNRVKLWDRMEPVSYKGAVGRLGGGGKGASSIEVIWLRLSLAASKLAKSVSLSKVTRFMKMVSSPSVVWYLLNSRGVSIFVIDNDNCSCHWRYLMLSGLTFIDYYHYLHGSCDQVSAFINRLRKLRWFFSFIHSLVTAFYSILRLLFK